MNQYDISEQSYKNGLKVGYDSGFNAAAREVISFIEARFAHLAVCDCGHRRMVDFYNYCPYCGKKYE